EHSDNDPKNLVRATLLKTMMDRQDNLITTSQAIDQLNNVKTKWRGDKIERELLISLATYYKQKDDLISALRIYANLPDIKDTADFHAASEIYNLYKEIFSKN